MPKMHSKFALIWLKNLSNNESNINYYLVLFYMKTNKLYTLYHDLTVRKKWNILLCFTVHTKASYFSIFGEKKYKS